MHTCTCTSKSELVQFVYMRFPIDQWLYGSKNSLMSSIRMIRFTVCVLNLSMECIALYKVMPVILHVPTGVYTCICVYCTVRYMYIQTSHVCVCVCKLHVQTVCVNYRQCVCVNYRQCVCVNCRQCVCELQTVCVLPCC